MTARIRSSAVASNNQQVIEAANEQQELLVAQGMFPYAETVRLGQHWGTMATAAVAALVVRPTTTAALELWNGYPAGGKSLVIDRLFTHNLVGVANSAFGIYAMVTAVKAAPSSASLVVNGGSGKTYGGPVVNAVSTTVIANGWFPFGNAGQTVTVTTPGAIAEAKIEGRLIVPPGASLCIHVVASTTSATFTSGASWQEIQITNEL